MVEVANACMLTFLNYRKELVAKYEKERFQK